MCSPLLVMGKLTQPGGNDWDFAAAQEWVAHFLHEAVIDRPADPRVCPSTHTLPIARDPKPLPEEPFGEPQQNLHNW